jgi:ribonuclease I
LRGLLAALFLLISIGSAHAQTLEYFSLQMAWLPGQCLVTPDLPDCDGLSIQNPKGRTLTLIGLKPESRPGSASLRDCDPMARAFTTPTISPDDKVTACSLPAVKLDDALSAELGALMPGLAQCAERSYWSKYGSCSLLSPQRYFERAVARAKDLQRSLLNFTIADAMGQRIARAALVEAFEQQFGPDTARSLQLVCARSKVGHQSVLVEARIAINQLGSMRQLNPSGLWYPAGSAFKEHCPREFLIAEPGVAEPPRPEKAPIADEAPFPEPPAFPQP